jgi:transcription elongation factor GreA
VGECTRDGPRPPDPIRPGAVGARSAVATLVPVSDVHHLSQSTFDRLSAELEELTTVQRIDIARKIQTARELGDLSENGDYHAAKEEQGKMEARIRDLQALVENAEIIEALDTDKVSPGHVVHLRYEGDDDAERYLIGSIEERTGDVEVLTPGSPLGKALLGGRVGDWVDFQAPGGVLKVEIVEIEG